MKKIICLCLLMLGLSTHLLAQDIKKDTVYIGIYITSIHDIDFKQKEFATTFWLWMRYRNPQFDFYNNLEIPSAKSVDKSFFTMDTTGGMIYVQMKLQCVMKDSWRITNFPFDEQKLRISFENSQHGLFLASQQHYIVSSRNFYCCERCTRGAQTLRRFDSRIMVAFYNYHFVADGFWIGRNYCFRNILHHCMVWYGSYDLEKWD